MLLEVVQHHHTALVPPLVELQRLIILHASPALTQCTRHMAGCTSCMPTAGAQGRAMPCRSLPRGLQNINAGLEAFRLDSVPKIDTCLLHQMSTLKALGAICVHVQAKHDVCAAEHQKTILQWCRTSPPGGWVVPGVGLNMCFALRRREAPGGGGVPASRERACTLSIAHAAHSATSTFEIILRSSYGTTQ